MFYNALFVSVKFAAFVNLETSTSLFFKHEIWNKFKHFEFTQKQYLNCTNNIREKQDMNPLNKIKIKLNNLYRLYLTYTNMYTVKTGRGIHIVPIARLENFLTLKLSRSESFRALKLSRLKNFLTLKSYDPKGEFQGPKILRTGEFLGP